MPTEATPVTAQGPTADSTAASVPYDPTAETGILVVLPHPDDESFSSGGTLAWATSAGVPATYLCGTFGDMGRRMGRPAFTNREALRDVRIGELRDACRVLGIGLKFLGLRDKCVEFEDPAEVAASVRAVIDDLKPSAVITFYPGYGVHPDHDALGHATVLAVRGMPAAKRPRLLGVAVGDRAEILAELGAPDLVADIAEYGDAKIAALRAHRSQTEVMFAHWDENGKGEVTSGGSGDGADSADAAGARRRAEEEHEEFIKHERFYLLDPDEPTLLERQ